MVRFEGDVVKILLPIASNASRQPRPRKADLKSQVVLSDLNDFLLRFLASRFTASEPQFYF